MRRKRRTREHVIADLGVNHVERFALLCGFSVERVYHDYGIDLFISTYREDGEIENGLIPIQVKSSDRPSWIEGGQTLSLRVQSTHMEAWTAEAIPVFLVVYDASADEAVWLDVQTYVDEAIGPDLILVGSTRTLRIPRLNRLDVDSVRSMAKRKNDCVQAYRSMTRMLL